MRKAGSCGNQREDRTTSVYQIRRFLPGQAVTFDMRANCGEPASAADIFDQRGRRDDQDCDGRNRNAAPMVEDRGTHTQPPSYEGSIDPAAERLKCRRALIHNGVPLIGAIAGGRGYGATPAFRFCASLAYSCLIKGLP